MNSWIKVVPGIFGFECQHRWSFCHGSSSSFWSDIDYREQWKKVLQKIEQRRLFYFFCHNCEILFIIWITNYSFLLLFPERFLSKVRKWILLGYFFCLVNGWKKLCLQSEAQLICISFLRKCEGCVNYFRTLDLSNANISTVMNAPQLLSVFTSDIVYLDFLPSSLPHHEEAPWLHFRLTNYCNLQNRLKRSNTELIQLEDGDIQGKQVCSCLMVLCADPHAAAASVFFD